MLFRTNAQSQAYEEALAEAGVPYVVQGAERFFERPEVRQAMVALRAATRTEDAAGGAARQRGGGAGSGRLAPGRAAARRRRAGTVGGARRPGGPGRGVRRRRRTLADFTEELARRAALQHAPTVDGVTLASLHSAKGLEWDAVFLVGLVEGVLPTSYAKTPAAVEEERRLLYVGITRARQWLTLSYANARAPGWPGHAARRGSCRSTTRRRRARGLAGGATSATPTAPGGASSRPVPGVRDRPDGAGRPQAGPVCHLSVHNG